jgi:WD40 repeat protein
MFYIKNEDFAISDGNYVIFGFQRIFFVVWDPARPYSNLIFQKHINFPAPSSNQLFKDQYDSLTKIWILYNSKILITHSKDLLLRFWNFYEGNCFAVRKEHKRDVEKLILSKNEEYLASQDFHDICIWNSRSAEIAIKGVKILRLSSMEVAKKKYLILGNLYKVSIYRIK